MYRATPITQQDGSPQANSNCRMASAATGLDFDTLGAKTSTGKKMRDYSGDPEGGTTADDAVQAWSHYEETLSVRNGQPWSEVIASLREGRLVHLDVWAHTCGGPCSTGNVGHTIAVAPEQHSDGKWLTADPWCKPGKWVWWSESKLRAGAEEWADRCGWRSATLGGPRDIRDIEPGRLRAIIKELMTLWTPDHPLDPKDDDYVPSTMGTNSPCLWTRTAAHPDSSAGGLDVAIKVTPEEVSSTSLAVLASGLAFYRDADLKDKLGTMSSKKKVALIGSPLGVSDKSRAVIVNTGTPYNDGEARPTVVYVKKDVPIEPAPAPPEPPPADCDAALAALDAEWRAWLGTAPDAP